LDWNGNVFGGRTPVDGVALHWTKSSQRSISTVSPNLIQIFKTAPAIANWKQIMSESTEQPVSDSIEPDITPFIQQHHPIIDHPVSFSIIHLQTY
jgi:hypothetical protein